jgi:hypothetical protein
LTKHWKGEVIERNSRNTCKSAGNAEDYCKGQSPSSDEIGWVKEYSKLARSRLKQINEKRHQECGFE